MKKNWEKVKEQTLEGKTAVRIRKLYDKSDPIKVILYNNLCPGDLIVMTSAIEALHQQYPGRYITDVDCFHKSIYENNPYITNLNPDDPEVIHLWTTYPLVNKSNQRPIHFMNGYVDWLSKQFDIDLILDTNRPHLYLSKEEKESKDIVEELSGVNRYTILSCGFKSDYTVKRWSTVEMQKVVDHFKGRIVFVQIGLSKHNHLPLKNVINLIDKTNIRQLILACYHAQLGIGPITCIQHMFAAFQRPYIALHGAREPTAFTQYPTQFTLSNVGSLKCCEKQACWKSRIVPLNDGDAKDKRLCAMPMVDSDGTDIAKCMLNIKNHQVIEIIETLIENKMIKI